MLLRCYFNFKLTPLFLIVYYGCYDHFSELRLNHKFISPMSVFYGVVIVCDEHNKCLPRPCLLLFLCFLAITKYSKDVAFSISEFKFLKNWSFEKKGRYVLLNWLFYPHICTKSPFLSILCALFWEKILRK